MFRNNNQLGGNMGQLRERINFLINQPVRQVSTVPEGAQEQIQGAVRTIGELNRISQQVKEALAKQKVKINTMLGKLNNAELKRIREQQLTLPPIPPREDSNNFITSLERLASALDNYNRERNNLAPLTTYLTGLNLTQLSDDNRQELLKETVESMLSSVRPDQGQQIVTALNGKFGQDQVTPVVQAFNQAGQPQGQPQGQQRPPPAGQQGQQGAPPPAGQQQGAPPAGQQQGAPPPAGQQGAPPAGQQQGAPPPAGQQGQQGAPPPAGQGQQGGSNIIKLNLINLL